MLVKKYSKTDLSKFFKPSECAFLCNLSYWLSNKNNYGVQKFEKKWIYNTLEQWAKQTKFSKISIRRAIENLKKQNIVFSEYLSQNKRDRTLFYSINYKKLNEILENSSALKNNIEEQNEHMGEHMYYIDNNNNFNKSYKSLNNFSEKNFKDLGENISNSEILVPKLLVTAKLKNTTVQDMVKVFNDEFSDITIKLDKNLARNLVAAFKMKFESSLEKWKNFLKLIKTSSYLMGEKFKLTLRWLLKFSTIDRLKLGELGVKIKEFFTNEIQEDELQKRVEQHIAETDEDENFKTFRKQIAQKLSNAVYLTWFAKIKFKKQKGITNIIYPNKFVEDTIKIRYTDKVQNIFAECI